MAEAKNKYLSTWVEISKSALLHNLDQFIRLAGKMAKICPIVKSNAYGHDMCQTAKTLQKRPIWGFGVVNLEEGLLLRKNGIRKPILVLGYVNGDLKEGIQKNLAFSVYSLDLARQLNILALKQNKKVNIHLKVDVGTSRLGILPADLKNDIKEIKKLSNLRIEGIFSHLADSENKDWSFTRKQLRLFDKIIGLAEGRDQRIPLKHIACSAAALGSSDSLYDLIRPGISLYGFWPSRACRLKASKIYPWLSLKPALSWQTKIIQIKKLPPNTNIGYGRTFKTNRTVKLAVLPVGYAEGLDRRLSNKGEVLISGRRCPILGRVCMNMVMVDVSAVKKVRPGDKATLIGRQGRAEITAEELAADQNTINYEVVTRINPQVKRIFL
ncbi:MAG: alanine racemase [Patescibacteria group bacterium]